MNTNEKTKKQKVIQIAIVAMTALLLGLGTIWALKSIDKPSSSPKNADQNKTVLRTQANSQYDQANKFLKSGDKTAAKKAFEKSRDLYKQTGDTQRLKDIDLSLSLIQHMNNQTTPTQPKQAPPSTQEAN